MSELVNNLRKNSNGIKNDTRKQHIESMEYLSKKGYKYMEIRATEISQEDLNYFRDQGMFIQVVNDDETMDYPYFRLTWELELDPITNIVATGYAVGFGVMGTIFKIIALPIILCFKFFGLFL